MYILYYILSFGLRLARILNVLIMFNIFAYFNNVTIDTNMKKIFTEEPEIDIMINPVNVSEDPLLSVVKGTGLVLEDIKKFKEVLIQP